MHSAAHRCDRRTRARRASLDRRLLPALALALGMGIAPGDALRPARAQPFLAGDEVRELIVGNHLQGSYGAQRLVMVWYANGVVRGAMGLTGSDDGTWEIKDNLYCHEWSVYFGSIRRCYAWSPEDGHYLLVNRDPMRTWNIQGRIEPGRPSGY